MRKPPKKVAIALVALEAVSAAFAFRDLAQRDDSEVRGPKVMWRIIIGANPGNSVIYWLFGRL